MCDVPSIAVFCSESVECLPGTASEFFLKLLVTIPVAPIITGIIVHFRFHIRCIPIHKLLYFNFFSASFAQHFCLRVLPHLLVFMFFITIILRCLNDMHKTKQVLTSPYIYTSARFMAASTQRIFHEIWFWIPAFKVVKRTLFFILTVKT